MARYAADHKQQIHDQILAAARALMARGGIAEIGIPRVMGQAGLTHGGFYAHFRSKSQLYREAIKLTAEHRPMSEGHIGEPGGQTRM